MVDCTVSVAIEQRSVLAAALEQRSILATAVEQRSTIAAALTERSELGAAVTQRSAIAAAVSERESLAAAVSEREVLAVEVDLGGLTGWDRAKLDSVDWGATRHQPDLVKLAYASEVSTGGGGELGGSGDSVAWIGTDAFQEVIRVLVPHPAWRGNGYLEWDVTMAFFNPSDVATGAETVTMEVQRCEDYPDDVGTPELTFGLPTEIWTTIVTCQSGSIPAGVGTGVLTLVARIRSTGHTITTFRQAWSSDMVWSNLAGGDPSSRRGIGRTVVDVTKDQLLRLRFKADQAVQSGQNWTITSASCVLVCPRDGHGF